MKKYLLVIVFLFCCGCVKTPSGITVDPNAVTKIEAVTEGGASILVQLTPILGPLAALIGGGILGALQIWRKVKPQILEAQGEAEISYAVTESLVEAIELLKKEQPEQWKKLGSFIDTAFKSAKIDTKILENVIRGIRGLPPKG
jgi:hypothetical protein